jgi:gamma-glutamyltranspeptidase / glutathione hydrolase
MPGDVASGHPISSAVGREVLRRGGNAYDATIAVSAALTVVQPHMNGLGSDFFAVVRDGTVRSINGSGWAAALATPEFFRDRGLRTIPTFGPLSSFTVPGLVACWGLLAERASRSLPELLAPAIGLAREGFAATPSLRRAISATRARADDDWKATYGTLRAGVPLRQPTLSRTLEIIARDAGHSFYHGELARTIEQDMLAKGGLLRFSDLDTFRPEWTTPLRVRYRGWDVHTTPPNSQGATALIWLNLLQREDLAGMVAAEYVRALLRTQPIAYAYRARYIGDPRHVTFSPKLLEGNYPYAASAPFPAGPASRGDTTAFSVTDGSSGISAIQSNYMGFGSGQCVAGTGINLNNRGCYFTLAPEHHNALAPGRRTFHTLMALLARGPDREVLLGTMGGDVQPETNIQVLTRVLDRNAGIQDAIAAPRFAVPSSIYRTAALYAEKGLALAGARPVGDDRDLVGHAHGIIVGAETEVGIDPRGDGLLDPGTVRTESRRKRGR